MFAAVSAAAAMVPPDVVHRIVRLAVLVLFGAGVYAVTLWTIARTHVLQVREALGAMRR